MRSYRAVIMEGMREVLRTVAQESASATRGVPMVTDNPLNLVQAGAFPFIAYAVLSETYERTSNSGIYEKILTAEINYAFNSDDPQGEASRALGDIEEAFADHTMGARVTDLSFVSNQLDVMESGLAVLSITMEFEYRISEDAPDRSV